MSNTIKEKEHEYEHSLTAAVEVMTGLLRGGILTPESLALAALLAEERMHIPDGEDATGQRYLAERCKSERCRGHRITAWLVVDDESWLAVTGGTGGILCPACFDAEAQARGVRYTVKDFGVCTWMDSITEGPE